jgi:hypothetical protein
VPIGDEEYLSGDPLLLLLLQRIEAAHRDAARMRNVLHIYDGVQTVVSPRDERRRHMAEPVQIL